MPGSGGCLRQKKLTGYLNWIINFWISEVKQYEENIANIGEGWLFCAEVRSLLSKLIFTHFGSCWSRNHKNVEQ